MTESSIEQRLAELAVRIERLVQEPDEVGELWIKLASPVMRALKWEPTLSVEKAQSLLQQMQYGTEGIHDLTDAVAELDNNVQELERACVVHDEVPSAYLTWMWRLYGVLTRASELLETRSGEAAVGFAGASALRVLPPLTSQTPDDEAPMRVGQVDALLEAALSESELIGRRRRLLEAARELLLDTSTAVTLDPEQARARYDYIAQQITRMNRFEAAGIDPEVGLGYQLKEATRRHQGDRAHAVLSALSEMAAQRGDDVLEAQARRGLERVRGGSRETGHTLDSLQRSCVESLGQPIVEAVHEHLQRARAEHGPRPQKASVIEQMRWEQYKRYHGAGAEDALLSASLSVDGAFDLGGVMSPIRVKEEVRLRRQVSFPTQEMVITGARRVEDIPDAVLRDPRTILYDLAAGRLLARRFVREEVAQREVGKMASEVRVYVLDGSGSMIGPRARMRDAIMVSELSTMVSRLLEPDRDTHTVLYYRYFNEKLLAATRVDSPDTAMTAIGDVVTSKHIGGTNIEHALLASFEQIRQARKDDPDLARAQIVLVTDGEAPVELKRIAQARAATGELPIGVSVVALGEENPALREMAALQRMRGERVFYHFIPDATLEAIVSGRAHGTLPVHLPAGVSIAEIAPELTELADRIDATLRERDIEAMEGVDDWTTALREVGLDPTEALCEGERARVEALRRDRDALRARFDRWFPPPPAEGEARDSQATARRADDDAEDLESVRALLHGVANVVDVVASSELRRQADAVEILERLLLDAGIGPWRYHELQARYRRELADAIAPVRASVGLAASPT